MIAKIENHPVLRMRIAVATAKQLFPGTPPGLFFDEAPFDGRGRFMSVGQAFRIALAFHLPRREAAKSARRSAFTRARYWAERAARFPIAVDHVAQIVAAEFAHLATVAGELGGDNDVARLHAAASGIAGQAERGRARLVAQLEKLGAVHG